MLSSPLDPEEEEEEEEEEEGGGDPPPARSPPQALGGLRHTGVGGPGLGCSVL